MAVVIMVAVLCGVSVVTVIDVVAVVVAAAVGMLGELVVMTGVVVVVDGEVAARQALHNEGQFNRTTSPIFDASLHAATVCEPSCPHSGGSGLPSHKPVVVAVVVLVSVVVVEVTVVVDVVEDVHGSPT